jgi:hypothetical protein
MYGVYSAKEITLPTIRAVRSTKTYKKKPINPYGRSNTLPLHHCKKQCTHSQDSLMPNYKAQYQQSRPSGPCPITNPSQQPPSDTNDLKLLLKTLFEQLGTMLNLLSTVLSKLP